MDTKANNISPHKALIAGYIALITLLSTIFIICAYAVKDYPGAGYSTENPRIIAFGDKDGRTVILSPDNALTVTLEESGKVSDITLSANGRKVFYVLTDTDGSVLCSRTLSSLTNDRTVISDRVKSYLISKSNERLAYLTKDGILYYLDSSNRITEVSERVDDYYLSEDGRTLIYTAGNEIGIPRVYLFDGKSSSLLYKNARILDVFGDLESLLLGSESSLIRFDVRRGTYEILSVSFEKLVASYGDVIYYSLTNADGSSSLYCHDGNERLLSDKLSSVVFTAKAPMVVFTEMSEDGLSSVYKLSVGGNGSPITLAGEELVGFIATDDAAQLFYNDVSGEQEMLIKATLSGGTVSKLTVVDTDTDHICGIVLGKVIYIKNFNPISCTADLYCNSERLRSGVSLTDISELPDHTPAVRSYTWVHRGIIGTGYACIDVYGADTLTYSAGGKIYTFDGKDEREIGIGAIKNSFPISEDTVVLRDDGILRISNGGKFKEKDYTVSEFIRIKPYGAK